MKKLTVLFCLFVVAVASAQNAKSKPAAKSNASANDWDQLDQTFIKLVDALVTNDKVKFTSLSLREVDCVDCVGPTEYQGGGAFVPAEFFLAVIGKNFTGSPVYQAMAKKGYSFSSIVIKDFKPKVLPRDYPKDLKLYEVWVETYRPNEFSKGHKGTSHSFRFVKINGKFLFYGLTSLP